MNPEAATVHQCTEKWLSAIKCMRTSVACKLSVHELDELESHILHGVSVPVESEPEQIHYKNTTTVYEHHSAVAERISEYISIGAVRKLPSSEPIPSLVQPLHVIIKPNKKPRLVIDLSRNLNELLPHVAFQYTSIKDAVRLSKHQCFYSKLDISNCFLSFPLNPNCYKYFTFCFDNQYYQFVRLPFGLSSAPRICTLLLSVIQFVLEQKGLSLVRYLDDFLFISPSREQSAADLSIAINVLQEYGLIVNQQKTEGPAQQIQFLGIQLDSVNQILSVSDERVNEMILLLNQHISTPVSAPVLVKDIMSFVGKLSFVSQILIAARPFMRRLLDAIKGKRKQSRCRLPNAFKLDCAVWLQRIHRWNGLIPWSIHTQQPFVIVSDASTHGFGFYLQSYPSSVSIDLIPQKLLPGSGISGNWHPSMSDMLTHRSIAYLELFSVVFALTLLAPALSNHSVLILTDNESNVPIVNKQRTKSTSIINLLRSLAELSATYVFSCSARHISGVSNVLADFLSRPALHMHDHINQWSKHELSHSQPLLYVYSVCSSSLHLPNPTPTIIQPVHALNVQLNYLPSLMFSPNSHYVQTQRKHINHINETTSNSVQPSH